jgi:TolA-binding protein
MKKVLSILCLTLVSHLAFAQQNDFYIQKQNDVEFKRLNQEIARLKNENEQQAIYLRGIEKKSLDANKELDKMNKKIESLLDLWVNFENVSLPNLVAADKALANRINETNEHITEQTKIWNWGEESRNCEGIGTHQQVKTVIAKDGQSVTRYLCFDGKVLHLNTISNIPPVE